MSVIVKSRVDLIKKTGIDFWETFVPVSWMESLRFIASFLAKLKIKICQYDVTTAYLNEKLDEEIFMKCLYYFDKILELITNENF